MQNSSDGQNPFATRQTLLLRLRADAPEREIAWAEFNAQYAPIIAGFARRIGVHPQEVADVVQDVLAGFFAAAPKFQYNPTRGRFRGYLKTCTCRAIWHRAHKNPRFSSRSLEEIDPSALHIETTWNDVWEHDKLQRALDIIRARYASRPDKAKTFKAFEMFVLFERSSHDVANELDMSVESVHQAKTRITNALKAVMDEIDAERG